jgi:hypothetical protein
MAFAQAYRSGSYFRNIAVRVKPGWVNRVGDFILGTHPLTHPWSPAHVPASRPGLAEQATLTRGESILCGSTVLTSTIRSAKHTIYCMESPSGRQPFPSERTPAASPTRHRRLAKGICSSNSPLKGDYSVPSSFHIPARSLLFFILYYIILL